MGYSWDTDFRALGEMQVGASDTCIILESSKWLQGGKRMRVGDLFTFDFILLSNSVLPFIFLNKMGCLSQRLDWWYLRFLLKKKILLSSANKLTFKVNLLCKRRLIPSPALLLSPIPLHFFSPS